MPRPALPKLRRFEVRWRGAQIWTCEAVDEVAAMKLAEEITGWPGEALEIRELEAKR